VPRNLDRPVLRRIKASIQAVRIEVTEKRQAVSLPASYRPWLSVGRSAGMPTADAPRACRLQTTTPMEQYTCVRAAWTQCESELRGYLARRLADPALADDLAQDVFVKAMREGERFCRLDNPRAWLFQVARNAVVDHFRLRKNTVPVETDLPAIDEPAAPVDALSGCIARVLGELPAEDADVIRRCDLEGMRLKDYAATEGLKIPTVKSRLQRARRRMRDHMTLACQVQFDEGGRVCCHVPRSGN
jgi:RNA polymerase sigma-70 factor (ECF subfamily)